MSPIRNESKTKTSFALEDHQMGSSSNIEAVEEASVELIRKVVTCATAEFPKTPEQKGFAQCSAAVMSSQWKQEAYRSRREELAKLRERRDKRYDELQRRMDVARSEAKQFISQRRDQRTRMNLALQSINFQRSVSSLIQYCKLYLDIVNSYIVLNIYRAS